MINILLILLFANSNFAVTQPGPRSFPTLALKEASHTFYKAMDEFSENKYKDSASHFMQVYTNKFTPKDEKYIALYNAALSYERNKQYKDAEEYYKKIVDNKDLSFLYKDSYYRISACCTETKDWSCVISKLNKWKDQKALTLSEEFEFRIRIGSAYKKLGSYKDSADYLETALKVLKNNKKFLVEDAKTLQWNEEKINILGLWGFEELAETYKEQGKQIILEAKDSGHTLLNALNQKIELKSYYYVKAEDTYIDMISYGDRDSSTKGVYNIGLLYEDIYDNFKKAPIPENIKEKKLEKEYISELDKVLQPLLEKAKIAYQKNIDLGKDYKFTNQWIENSTTRRKLL